MYSARLGRCIAIHWLWHAGVLENISVFAVSLCKACANKYDKKITSVFIYPGFSQDNNQLLPNDFNVSAFITFAGVI